MKYNFDTILKEFKPVKEEKEDNSIFENCIIVLAFAFVMSLTLFF